MKYLFVFCLVLSFQTYSQNLISNSDFESKDGCPNAPGQIHFASGWFSVNSGTPDYFNDCSSSFEFGTEFNKKGGQIAHSGHGYAGIQVSDLHRNLYYEYIETELASPLQAGKTYCIKLFVSLGKSDCAVKEFGAILSQNHLNSSGLGFINLPYIHLESSVPLTDTLSWMCINGMYKAAGNENYLTIGCFGKEEDFMRLKQDPKLDESFFSAYYFIDDVSLEAVKNKEDCNCLKAPGQN
jgi:hypothetical protein